MNSVRLGEIASFVRGITFKPSDVIPATAPNAVQCMRTKNVQRELDLTDVWGVSRDFVRRDEQLLESGDLLISSANSWNLVGKCCWVPALDHPATFGGFVTVLRGASGLVDQRYLYHFFSMQRTQETVRSFSRQTTNISNLDLKRCANLLVPLPEIGEQKRIAAVLDQVDALRTKRREAITLLDDLARSIFRSMFSGIQVGSTSAVSLDEVLQRRMRSGVSPSSRGDIRTKVLTLSAVTRGRFDEEAWKEGFYLEDVTPSHAVRRNLFLVCRGNGNKDLVGRGVFPRSDMDDTVYPDTVLAAPIRSEVVVPEYLEYVWSSSHVRRQIESIARTTNGTYKVNQKTIGAVSFALPKIEKQRAFQAHAEAIEQQKAIHLTHLASLDELFTSLQQRAFNGTLWQDQAA
nr:restriction endonuclease subunit S [Streptomyces sp. WMMB 714]